uniref:Uncharacterized protein n=1 Tax=Rhizophora mucronata TaxID=61149 RepID=A0A2P2JXE5_RHIMU
MTREGITNGGKNEKETERKLITKRQKNELLHLCWILPEIFAGSTCLIFLAYLAMRPLVAAPSQFVASQACPSLIFELDHQGAVLCRHPRLE